MPELPWALEEGTERLKVIEIFECSWHLRYAYLNLEDSRGLTFHCDHETHFCQGSPSILEEVCDCSSVEQVRNYIEM